MKKYIILSCILTLFYACNNDDDSSNDENESYFVVANRGEGTISIYDETATSEVTKITLSGTNSAPTYTVYSSQRDILYVADFNNQRIVGYKVEGFTKTVEFLSGEGSFHMWLNDVSNQLWVNNIVSKTTTVIDLNTGNVLATLNLPTEINLPADAAQHDVILSPNGNFSYVSIFSETGANYVVQYNTSNQTVMNTLEVGGDPHLSMTSNNLYILSQDDSNIIEYSFDDLTPTGRQGNYNNAHGVVIGKNNTIYITDISGRSIGAFNTSSETITATTNATATMGSAHNLAYNPNNDILALTMSGGNTVEFFNTNTNSITSLNIFNSGENPFGIVFINR